MRYFSTRSDKYTASASEAILAGIAPDGGLFVPESFPQPDFARWRDYTYQEVAVDLFSLFLTDFSPEAIKQIVEESYSTNFDSPQITPIHWLDEDTGVLEMWHGPTLAFKDLALQCLPQLFEEAKKIQEIKERFLILTATSGDTGKAAMAGFSGKKDALVAVFYPHGGVSSFQERQMLSNRGDNVRAFAVEGNFDDCQRMIKQATSDPLVLSSLDGVSISSANSINVGRLMPQIVYYYTSYAKLVESGAVACGDPVNFVVPTGNFGDILAGYFAKLLGLPVNRLICASNTNNVLTDFLNTGTYSIHRTFTPTISPSMDILISSNLERLLFMASGYDDDFVSEMMKNLQKKGSYSVPKEIMAKITATFAGCWTDEDTCRKTIHDLFENEHVLIDPHTAVALAAKKKYEQETGDHTPSVILSTASPYKFTHDVLACIAGEDMADDFAAMERLHALSGVKIPPSLAALKDMDVRFTRSIEIEDGMQVIADRMKEVGNVHD